MINKSMISHIDDYYVEIITELSDSKNRSGWASSMTFDTKVKANNEEDAIKKGKIEFYKKYPNQKIKKANAYVDTSLILPDMPSLAKGGKIERALNNIDKWMPEDFELQKEYYQLINDKNQKGMEEFLDMYADQDRLMRYGIQYEDLGKLSEAIINGSEYAKGGKLPNPSNLYSLMIKDRETGYGMIADGKVYTINEALAEANKLNESDDFENGLDRFVDVLSVEELLKRPTLPKSSKKIIYDNYKEKVKLMNYLIERFGTDGIDWQRDFAKGGPVKKIIKKKMFDINDDEISEDIFEWALENVPEEFEFEEDEEESFRNSDFEDVIDEINSRLNDYELLVDYEEDRIYVNIHEKEKMADGGLMDKIMFKVKSKKATQYGWKPEYYVVGEDKDNDTYVLVRADNDYIKEWEKKYTDKKPGFNKHEQIVSKSEVEKMEDGGYMADGGQLKEFNLREIKSLSKDNQKYLTDDNGNSYIYENGVLYDVEVTTKSPYFKKGTSHRMSKIKVNIMAKGGETDDIITIDLDANFTGDGTIDVKKHVAKIGKKFNIKIVPSGKSWNAATVEYKVTGKREDILKFLSDDSYDEDEFGMGYDNSEIEEFFPELFKDGGYMAKGGMYYGYRARVYKVDKDGVFDLIESQDFDKKPNDETLKELAKKSNGQWVDLVYNHKSVKEIDLTDGYMADGGDVDEPDAEMEKLVDEHTKEAKKNRVKITNLGWSQGDDFIVSKTTERKDGSDVLTSEISNGVVTHDWDSYKRGGKLKTNPAKFRDKVKAITKKLTGTKVPKKYKKDYGATYDKKEANTAAKRIAGAKLAEVRAKLAKKKK